MTSLPNTFSFGSASSTSVSVGDAIRSYRRAQYLVAGSKVASASETPDFDNDEDSEAHIGYSDDEEFSPDPHPAPRPRSGEFIGQLDWDEDVQDSEHLNSEPQPNTIKFYRAQQKRRAHLSPNEPEGDGPSLHETTPLLRKVSFQTPEPQRTVEEALPDMKIISDRPNGETTYLSPPLRRRSSAASHKSMIKYNYGGRSTFGQTLFNSIAILLGVGMLSEPLAFAYSGWAVGTLLIISYGFLACYTAKILAKIILSDPRLRSYSDIGRKAFGPRSTFIISILFCLELFAVSVILVTLYADSLHTIIPHFSVNTYKVLGMIVLVPTVFLPLSLLSYTSILGIISIIMLIVVIFIDGFSKKTTPGSFWEPAETTVGVQSLNKLGIAFGLFMAGFSGHAVIPSLARDMTDPSQFDTMINWAFVVATLIYTLIGYAGYFMFGNSVSEEISIDLLHTIGYNPILNQATLWMLVVSPLSKFALNNQPLNATIEILLGLDTPISSPEEASSKPHGLTNEQQGPRVPRRRILAMLQRVVVTAASVIVSILVPDFSSAMAFLGSFSAFLICIIGPVSAKAAITGRCGIYDMIVIATGVVMAIWGTAAAFMAT